MNSLLDTFGHITQLMWQRGWNEGNGGNITLRMTEAEIAEFNGEFKESEPVLLNFDASEVAGEYFLCKGTGKFFRHIAAYPENNLAIIRISEDGKNYVQQWGKSKPTSEVAAHLLSHTVRKLLSKGVERVIMHCHLTHMIALSFVLPATDESFSNHLWWTMPECAVMFPDGVGVLPYLTPGTLEIGMATAQKMKDFQVVLWAHHGIFISDKNLETGFGLLETLEKSAEIVLKVKNAGAEVISMSKEEIRLLSERFSIVLNPKLLWKE